MSPLACLCLIALVVSVNTVLRDGNMEKAIERGDAYIDKMLQEMFEKENDDYDPYKMEDSVVGFNKKVIFVNVSGEAKLHDGYITGLRTLHRSGHCSLTEKDGRLAVKADMGAGVLDFHYSGSAKFMNYGPTITVQGTLAYVEVQMEFTVDSKTGENGKLEKFVIDDMRGMKVWVSGLGPLNWAVNPIISGVTAIFKRFVRNFLENKVKSHIAERIPNYKFPVEEDIVTEATTSSSDVITEVTKELTETPPVSDEATKESTETPPVSDEATKESTETPPVSDEATKESTETPPVSDEATKESTETSPVSDEATNESTETTLVSEEIAPETSKQSGIADESADSSGIADEAASESDTVYSRYSYGK